MLASASFQILGLDVLIVADGEAQTIVLTFDLDSEGATKTYTFSGTDLLGFPLAMVMIED